MAIEEEVKLAFRDHESARRAVTTAGGRLVVSRRLLDDQLYDTADGWLARSGRALRLRRDGPTTYLTFKGPAQPGPVKSRQELETGVGSADVGHEILTALGFRPRFRLQKYREEFALGATRVAVDETPIGVYVEVEGAAADIEPVANQLGRGRRDFILASYPELYKAHCASRGIDGGDLVFDDAGPVT